MPIESAIWIQDPPLSSYPACIAVKAAGMQSFEAGEIYLRLAREAIMIYKQNISELSVLLNIAKDVSALMPSSFDFVQFKHDLHSEEALEAFRKDVAEVQSKQITRFPTLLFRKQGKPSLIITGYRPFKAISAIMDEMEIIAQDPAKDIATLFYTRYSFKTEREKKEMEDSGFIIAG
jgi:predicted DsbA family dithiol-disulfide isomerase